ncbi:hypothetical protein JS562_41595 [Agrobacterium sp. S2]|nr:hypothetical protein [Agrobacterium sp. S2]
MRHCPAANEAMPLINRSVVLVAKDGNGDVALVLLASIIQFGLRELHRPPGVTILLPQLCWIALPVVWYLVRLEMGLLSIGIALSWCGDNRDIHNLPAHRQISGLREMTIKASKQVLNNSCLHEMFAKQPDRLETWKFSLNTRRISTFMAISFRSRADRRPTSVRLATTS